MLFLIDTLEVGGAEKSLLDILPRFAYVEPVLCHLYPGQALRADFQRAGVEVISLDLAGRYAFNHAVSSVRKLIRERQHVLIHATLMRADIVSRIAGRLEAVPVINTLVNDTYAAIRERQMSSLRRWKHRGMYLADRVTTPMVTRFVANSVAVKEASCVALGINPAKVDVIYRGRDVRRFTPEERPERQVILNVGRLLPHKGQQDLVRAMPTVLERYPKASLLIAGEGPYRAVLEGMIADLGLLGRINLLGTRTDIPQLLQSADIFVSPSHYEGLPGAVVEAMLAGLPVVLSDMDVHREMITDHDNGRLVPLQDAAALAETLIELLEDPRRRKVLSERARSKAIRVFDIENVVAQHEVLYARILGQAEQA